jgi:hypothetical protein
VTVSSTFVPTITTDILSFTIANSIKTVTLESLELNPTANVGFSVKIVALGDDDNAFVSTADFSINYDGTEIGTCPLDTAGTCTDQINFEDSGTYTIDASSLDTEVTDSTTVVVANMVMEINEVLEPTYTSDDILSLSVNVYDCTKTTLITTEAENCEITISLSDEASNSGTVLSGTLTKPITSGTATFDDIQILSSGEFNILFTSACTYIDNVKSSTRVTVTNSIKTVTISVSEEATIYFPFDVDVTILGDDDNNYLADCNLVLSADSDLTIDGKLSDLITSGASTLSVYFTSLDAKTLRASCTEDDSIEGTDTITIVKETLLVVLDHEVRYI